MVENGRGDLFFEPNPLSGIANVYMYVRSPSSLCRHFPRSVSFRCFGFVRGSLGCFKSKVSSFLKHSEVLRALVPELLRLPFSSTICSSACHHVSISTPTSHSSPTNRRQESANERRRTHGRTAWHSISTSVPNGNCLTATHVLAGFTSPQYVLYTSFIAVKCSMSERKTLTLKTASRLVPAAARTAERLRMH